jgi:hypothetical protein
MADVQVLYAESVVGTTTNSATWVDLVSIPTGSFVSGKKYLILANQISGHLSATNDLRVRLVHGTVPTVFDDASLSWEGLTDQRHEESFLFIYTQPDPVELIKLQFSNSSTTTGTNYLSQVIAICLDNLGTEGVDYFSNEDLNDYTLTNTPTAKAITSSFTPNGTDRWLFIGHMIDNCGATITTPKGFELYDSVAGVLSLTQQEGEDATNDQHGHNIYWVGVPTNVARTLAVRPFQSGASPDTTMLASRVIAINLAKFAQSESVFSALEVQPAATPSYTTIATVAPNPTNTGDWVVIAFLINDTNATSNTIETRLQINASGGGLVSNPNYSTGIPNTDNADATDEPSLSVFTLVSLVSGGARTINFDVSATNGTSMRVEDAGVVAFSVILGEQSAISVKHLAILGVGT